VLEYWSFCAPSEFYLAIARVGAAFWVIIAIFTPGVSGSRINIDLIGVYLRSSAVVPSIFASIRGSTENLRNLCNLRIIPIFGAVKQLTQLTT
jgi:uncharacterized membrane protein